MTAEQLREALKACGMTQRDFAAMLDLDATTVNRWMCGKAPVPTYASIIVQMMRDAIKVS
jgi:transcriptional regulator with XRE-family HTH domain